MGQVGPLRALAALSLALLLAPTLRAQDDSDAWRQALNPLIDRWANPDPSQVSSRVLRALHVVERHLDAAPADGEALLDEARLKLALPPPANVDDAAQAASIEAEQVRTAVEAADRAAKLLLGERRRTAQALAYLASRYLLHAELRALALVPGDEGSKQLVAERANKLQARRKALVAACKGQDAAVQLIAAEVRRVNTLKEIDALGGPPLPIGKRDTAGKDVDFTAYKGKALLVIFWSSQIPESTRILEQVRAVYAKLHSRGFEVLGVDLDEHRKAMDAYVLHHELPWREVFGGEGLASKVALAWGVQAIPDGVLVDATGRVRYVRPWELDLEVAVEDILARRDKAS